MPVTQVLIPAEQSGGTIESGTDVVLKNGATGILVNKIRRGQAGRVQIGNFVKDVSIEDIQAYYVKRETPLAQQELGKAAPNVTDNVAYQASTVNVQQQEKKETKPFTPAPVTADNPFNINPYTQPYKPTPKATPKFSVTPSLVGEGLTSTDLRPAEALPSSPSLVSEDYGTRSNFLGIGMEKRIKN